MAKIKTVFECQACGNQQSKWVGKCPQCGAWDSFLELNAQQIETLPYEISSNLAHINENSTLNKYNLVF